MKKYYAKPAPADGYDGKNYYDEDMAEDDKFGAGGNRDFGDINKSLRDDIKTKLENLDYDTDNSYDSDLTEQENYNILLDDIHYYFPKSPGRELQYLSLAKEFVNCKTTEENDIICKVLELEGDEPFINGTLTGYGQGDGMDYICPASLKAKVSFIEAVLMGTGTEYKITDEMLDLEGKTEDEIEEAFENADTFYDFTEYWKDEDVKAGIADIMHCSPNDVVLLEGDD